MRSPDTWIGIGLGIGLCAVIALALLPRHYHRHHDRQPPNKEAAAEQPTAGSHQQATNGGGTDEQQERGEQGWFAKLIERYDRTINALSTAIIAAFTLVLAVATGTLGYYAHQQARDMRDSIRATKDAALATSRSADAAVEANNLVQQANRPWIGLSLAGVPGNIAPDTKVTVTIVAINAGKSPARIILNAAASNPFDKFPDDPPYPVTSGRKTPSQTILVPGATTVSTFDFTPTKPDYDLIMIGTKTVFIYGTVTYVDLGSGKTHHTKVCYDWLAAENRWANSPTYNEAD